MALATTIGPNPAGQSIQGTAGTDVIKAGGGTDSVKAGASGDTVDGGANQDKLYGEGGNDVLNGGGSNDRVYGGEGDDILFGGGQDDRLFGGDGDDKIIGGDDNDVLYGDNPNDGNDNEGGADTFFFDSADGSDIVFDFETGVDKVVLTDGESYTLTYSGDNTLLTYGSTTVSFRGSTLTHDDIVTSSEAGWEPMPEFPILT